MSRVHRIVRRSPEASGSARRPSRDGYGLAAPGRLLKYPGLHFGRALDRVANAGASHAARLRLSLRLREWALGKQAFDRRVEFIPIGSRTRSKGSDDAKVGGEVAGERRSADRADDDRAERSLPGDEVDEVAVAAEREEAGLADARAAAADLAGVGVDESAAGVMSERSTAVAVLALKRRVDLTRELERPVDRKAGRILVPVAAPVLLVEDLEHRPVAILGPPVDWPRLVARLRVTDSSHEPFDVARDELAL